MDQHQFRIRLVADNNAKRERGLMFAEPLADDEAALFVFAHADRHGFWNKNVPFGLSLAFCDDNGQIVHFADMSPDDPTRVEPQTDNVRFVVEAKRGTFSRLGISKGDLIEYADNALRIRKNSERYAQNNENRRFQKMAVKTLGIDWQKLEVNLLADSLEENKN